MIIYLCMCVGVAYVHCVKLRNECENASIVGCRNRCRWPVPVCVCLFVLVVVLRLINWNRVSEQTRLWENVRQTSSRTCGTISTALKYWHVYNATVVEQLSMMWATIYRYVWSSDLGHETLTPKPTEALIISTIFSLEIYASSVSHTKSLRVYYDGVKLNVAAGAPQQCKKESCYRGRCFFSPTSWGIKVRWETENRAHNIRALPSSSPSPRLPGLRYTNSSAMVWVYERWSNGFKNLSAWASLGRSVLLD